MRIDRVSPSTTRVTSVTRVLKTQALVLGGTLAVFWAVFVVSSLLGGSLLRLGVIPRTTIGLRGILFAPFLHASLNHIVANSIPFVVLGWMVMLRDERHFIPVTLAAMVGSGLIAWLLGAPGTVHIGASGVIFGYLGFLMLTGWYTRSFVSILLSVIVTLVWGASSSACCQALGDQLAIPRRRIWEGLWRRAVSPDCAARRRA